MTVATKKKLCVKLVDEYIYIYMAGRIVDPLRSARERERSLTG